MIVKTNTGAMVAGPLSRAPDIKQTKSGTSFLSLSVKAHSVKDDSGKWNSVFVECCIWRDLERWDGLLDKGDFVVAFGRELKSHESGGKTYWNLDTDGLLVSGLVNSNWVQMAIDMMQPPSGPDMAANPDGFSEVEGETPFDSGLQASENDFQAGGVKLPSEPERQFTEDESRIIEDDADDLPF